MYIKISKDVERQYRKEVEQIINNKDFQKLRYYKQHNWSDRLMHSINVSYLSWLMARHLGCDAKAAARKVSRWRASGLPAPESCCRKQHGAFRYLGKRA